MSSNLMSLADDLKELHTRKPLTFKEWLDSDPADKELVLGYIKDESVTTRALLAVLRKNDIPITAETIKAYRESRS